MSYINRLFGIHGSHPDRQGTPTTDYDRYANQQRQEIDRGYNPYIEQGQKVGTGYADTSTRMGDNPADYYDELMKHYQQSDSYKAKLADLTNRGRSTAAAGGMVGTASDQENQMRIASALMDEDVQNWMKNVLGIQHEGREGEKDIYDKGYQSSIDKANKYASITGGQASKYEQEQRDRSSQRDALIKSLFSGLGGVIGSVGGPIGTAIGTNLGERATAWMNK